VGPLVFEVGADRELQDQAATFGRSDASGPEPGFVHEPGEARQDQVFMHLGERPFEGDEHIGDRDLDRVDLLVVVGIDAWDEPDEGVWGSRHHLGGVALELPDAPFGAEVHGGDPGGLQQGPDKGSDTEARNIIRRHPPDDAAKLSDEFVGTQSINSGSSEGVHALEES
jgi:hypothetical protein